MAPVDFPLYDHPRSYFAISSVLQYLMKKDELFIIFRRTKKEAFNGH